MIGRLLCRLGVHRDRYVFGEHNRYFECRGCKRRIVVIGFPGYQPIDTAWLTRSPPARPAPPVGGSGVARSTDLSTFHA